MSGEAFGLSAADETPDLDPKTFDFSGWVNGVAPTIRSVTLYQRADLLAVVDDLTRRLKIAESVPSEDRGLSDETPTAIQDQLEQVAHQFEASALVFKVQGRSDEYREKMAKRLKKQGITDEVEVVLHQLADAIVEPTGVTVDHLRQLGEASEAQLKILITASAMANFQPPRVDVPFSSASSRSRRGSS